MDRQQTEQRVMSVISTILKCPITAESSRENTAQWDSLKHIEIVFALEEELGVEFTEQEMIGINSVTDIVDLALRSHAA